MIEAFRITPEPDVATAFSGEGARKWGGRWNSIGVAMVYTAAARSLAILEVVVHMRGTPGRGGSRRPYLIYRISFDESLLHELSHPSLPPRWDSEPPAAATQAIGDQWVTAFNSPVLSIPSVLVPEERNYLLNPAHSGFSRIQIDAPVACHFDPRLL